MFAEAAAFEHIAKLLLAPAPARLGRVAQRVDELRRLARHTLGPLAHRRDLAVEQAEGVAPFGLDLTDSFLIFLQAFVYRSEEPTSELQSLMRLSYAVFCLKKKKQRLLHILQH